MAAVVDTMIAAGLAALVVPVASTTAWTQSGVRAWLPFGEFCSNTLPSVNLLHLGARGWVGECSVACHWSDPVNNERHQQELHAPVEVKRSAVI
jgi:hypothetical protein